MGDNWYLLLSNSWIIWSVKIMWRWIGGVRITWTWLLTLHLLSQWLFAGRFSFSFVSSLFCSCKFHAQDRTFSYWVYVCVLLSCLAVICICELCLFIKMTINRTFGNTTLTEKFEYVAHRVFLLLSVTDCSLSGLKLFFAPVYLSQNFRKSNQWL